MIDGIEHRDAVELSDETGWDLAYVVEVIEMFGGDKISAGEFLESLNVKEIPDKEYSWKIASSNYANGYADRLNSYNGLWSLGAEYGAYGVKVRFTESEYKQLLREGMPDIFEKVVYAWEEES